MSRELYLFYNNICVFVLLTAIASITTGDRSMVERPTIQTIATQSDSLGQLAMEDEGN